MTFAIAFHNGGSRQALQNDLLGGPLPIQKWIQRTLVVALFGDRSTHCVVGQCGLCIDRRRCPDDLHGRRQKGQRDFPSAERYRLLLADVVQRQVNLCRHLSTHSSELFYPAIQPAA